MFIAATSYFPLMYPVVLSLESTFGCQNFYIFLLAGFYEEWIFEQQLQSYFKSGSSTKQIFSKGDGDYELSFHYSILSDNIVLILDRSSASKTSLHDFQYPVASSSLPGKRPHISFELLPGDFCAAFILLSLK